MQTIVWVGVAPHLMNHSSNAPFRSSMIRAAVGGWIICNKARIEVIELEPIKARLSVYYLPKYRGMTIVDVTGKLFGFGALVETANEGMSRLSEITTWLHDLNIDGDIRVYRWNGYHGVHEAGPDTPTTIH